MGYAIDSQSVNNNKILKYINSNKVLHRCASHGLLNRGVDCVWDPTGVGIQMDTGIGLSDDCKSSDDAAYNDTGGTFNPACTTDTSKCGSLDLTLSLSEWLTRSLSEWLTRLLS